MSLFWNEKAKRKYQQRVISMLNDFHSDLISNKKDPQSARQVKKLMGEVKLCATKQEALELEKKVREAISYPSGESGKNACRDAVMKLKEVITGVSGFVESSEVISTYQRLKDLEDQLEQAKQEQDDAVACNDRISYDRAKKRIKALNAQLSLERQTLEDASNADVTATVAKTSMETAAIREKAVARGSESVQEAIEANKEADQASATILKNQEDLLSSTPMSDAEESDFDKARAEYLLSKEKRRSTSGKTFIGNKEDEQ